MNISNVLKKAAYFSKYAAFISDVINYAHDRHNELFPEDVAKSE